MIIPNATQRHAIVGATGSGKTQCALWHLSMRDIDTRPWIVYNFKTDKSIDSIPRSHNIGLDEIPLDPGVYIVHPHPSETKEVEQHMWSVWEKQKIGVYIDEGYMIGDRNPAFRAILTQGRSRENPAIVLSQRPVWMDRFVFSEADFFQIFRLNHKKDVKNVQEFIPHDIGQRLPEYHSYYYDVSANDLRVIAPVPSIDEIHATFERRLRRTRRTL